MADFDRVRLEPAVLSVLKDFAKEITAVDIKRTLDDLLDAADDLRREVHAIEPMGPWLRHVVLAAGRYDQAKQAWDEARKEEETL